MILFFLVLRRKKGTENNTSVKLKREKLNKFIKNDESSVRSIQDGKTVKPPIKVREKTGFQRSSSRM